MENNVTIKGTTFGFTISLAPEAAFDEIARELADKFKASAKFFGNASMAVAFEGRKLSSEEEQYLIRQMEGNSDVRIVCILEHNSETEEFYRKNLVDMGMFAKSEKRAPEVAKPQRNNYEKEAVSAEPEGYSESQFGMFYKGSLRSGQSLSSPSGLIILGDVNEGATVTAGGNIIVIGSVYGTVYAGANNNPNAFIIGFDMKPVQIRIDNMIGCAPDEEKSNRMPWKRKDKDKDKEFEPKIAHLTENGVYIEPINKSVLNNIIL